MYNQINSYAPSLHNKDTTAKMNHEEFARLSCPI